jgi:formiminotetrahydrofolate cyclodeaminase
MSNPSNIAQTTIAELADSIGSTRASPGAGVAGAVTLALAAACTAKAVAISLVHTPDNAVLRQSQSTLATIRRFALAGADRDADTFRAFIQEHSQSAVAQLIREADRVGHLIVVLSGLVEKVTPYTQANMTGDLVAARALMDAARKIQLANSTEAREEQATLDSKS